MTVSPDDIPDFDFLEDNGAVDVSPFVFLKPGGDGDFRALPVEADPKD
jgi:hypothetical protein